MTLLLLSHAMEPVLRDVRASGVPSPEVREEDWADDPLRETAYLCSADGSMSGIAVELGLGEVDQIVGVTDQVQDWVIEELQGSGATNWPPCPNHPDSHPLHSDNLDGVAMWTCPTDGTPCWPVGSLP